jgi:hypothetical protein
MIKSVRNSTAPRKLLLIKKSNELRTSSLKHRDAVRATTRLEGGAWPFGM